jgi:tetratricopeptide (TPR) repeat protein
MSTSSARIEELQKKFDENPRRYFAPLANEYRKAGHVDEAIALCRAHLPQQPGHMSGHIVFGQALYEKGELDQARGVFETALQLDPENLIALRHLGDIARERNDIAGARAWFRRVLDADPRNDEIVTQLSALDGLHPAAGSPYDLATAAAPVAGSAVADGHDGDGHDASSTGSDGPGDALTRPFPDDAPDDSDLLATQLAALSGAIENDGRAIRAPLVMSATDEARRPAADDAPLDTLDLDVGDFGLPEGDTQRPAPSAAVGAPEFDVGRSVAAPRPTASDAAHADEPVAPAPGLVTGGYVDDGESVVAADADIGLEPTAFVPPPRADAGPPPSASAAGGSAETDSAPEAGAVRAPAEDGRPAPTPPAFVTETMAELYLQQGFRDEALSVFRQLVQQNPADAALRERVERLEREIADARAGSAADAQPEAASTRADAAPPGVSSAAPPGNGQTVRQLFAGIGAKRPPRPRGSPVGASGPGGGPSARHAAAEGVPPVGLDEAQSRGDSAPASGAGTRQSVMGDAPDGAQPFWGTAAEALADVSTSVATPPGVDEARGPSLDALFGAGAGQGREEGASSLLADLYAPTSEVRTVPPKEKSAQPDRPGSAGLSLDQVFGKTPRHTDGTRRQPTFSFDQFFSGDAVADKPGPAQPDTAAPPDEDGANPDVAQFNAWLEGLKKK